MPTRPRPKTLLPLLCCVTWACSATTEPGSSREGWALPLHEDAEPRERAWRELGPSLLFSECLHGDDHSECRLTALDFEEDSGLSFLAREYDLVERDETARSPTGVVVRRGRFPADRSALVLGWSTGIDQIYGGESTARLFLVDPDSLKAEQLPENSTGVPSWTLSQARFVNDDGYLLLEFSSGWSDDGSEGLAYDLVTPGLEHSTHLGDFDTWSTYAGVRQISSDAQRVAISNPDEDVFALSRVEHDDARLSEEYAFSDVTGRMVAYPDALWTHIVYWTFREYRRGRGVGDLYSLELESGETILLAEDRELLYPGDPSELPPDLSWILAFQPGEDDDRSYWLVHTDGSGSVALEDVVADSLRTHPGSVVGEPRVLGNRLLVPIVGADDEELHALALADPDGLEPPVDLLQELREGKNDSSGPYALLSIERTAKHLAVEIEPLVDADHLLVARWEVVEGSSLRHAFTRRADYTEDERRYCVDHSADHRYYAWLVGPRSAAGEPVASQQFAPDWESGHHYGYHVVDTTNGDRWLVGLDSREKSCPFLVPK